MSSTPAITVTRRVEFSETDMAGILHFSNFFRFMETAEAELFRSLHLPLIARENGVLSGFPRARCSCDFSAPVRFGDLIEIRLFIEEVRSQSIHYRMTFIRIEPGPAQRVAKGAMVTVHAVMDAESGAIAAQPMSERMRSRLAALAGPNGVDEEGEDSRKPLP